MHLETGKRTHLKRSNLTKLQHNNLNFLRNNEQHAFLVVDKNVGLCAVNKNQLIGAMLNQHFGNAKTCERTPQEEAQEFMNKVIIIFFKK